MRPSFQTFEINICTQWRTQKRLIGGPKVTSHWYATHQYYGECRRQDHCRVVRGHAPEKNCKITLKIRVSCILEASFSMLLRD